MGGWPGHWNLIDVRPIGRNLLASRPGSHNPSAGGQSPESRRTSGWNPAADEPWGQNQRNGEP